MPTCRTAKIHEEHSARNADQGHTHHQGEIRDLPVEKSAKERNGAKKATPLKMNGCNIIQWRFGSDHFPF